MRVATQDGPDSAPGHDAGDRPNRRSPPAPSAPGPAADRLGTVALLVSCGAAVLLLPDLPFRHMDDLCYLAVVLSVPFLVALPALRHAGAAGLRAERALLAVFLTLMPLVYLGRCRQVGGGGWIWPEVLGLVGYGSLAVLGFFRYAVLLPAGIAAHGVLWDSWHYGNTGLVPDWYAVVCALVDLGVAAYAATRLAAWRRPA
ncbi:MAG: hypothetical protein HYZ53_17665 [Planctomycetes bacterium]|nr:hypothetical protein [Planctomycetota bacterium]